MINADAAYDKGYRGQGMVIAVIDTGIDYTHDLMVLSQTGIKEAKYNESQIESLLEGLNSAELLEKNGNTDTADRYGNKFYKTEKVPYAFNYVSGNFDSFNNGDSHGMHVAGIAAANNAEKKNKFDGVAPEAQVMSMKVFEGIDSLAYDDDILAALEDSISLGADVINMSLGSSSGPEDPLASGEVGVDYLKALENCSKNGIALICSSGNSDRFGYGNTYGTNNPLAKYPDTGLSGYPANAEASICVANVEAESIYIKYIKLKNDDSEIDFNEVQDSVAEAFSAAFDGQIVKYVVIDGFGEAKDYENVDVAGKIALVSRGETNFSDKVAAAKVASASGIILYNNNDNEDLIIPNTGDEGLPGAFISKADGEKLINAEVKEIIVNDSWLKREPSPAKGSMESSTSWGPTASLSLKPEITAPGGNIYSTVENNKYEVMTGTSMSAPQVSGAAALLKQYLRKNNNMGDSNMRLKQLIMNTASPVLNRERADGELLEYSPRRQGAGLINVKAAMNTDVLLSSGDKDSEPKLQIGDDIGKSFDLSFTAWNYSEEDQEYVLSASVQSDSSENIDGVDFITYDGKIFRNTEVLYNGVNVNAYASTSSAISGNVSTGTAIVLKPGENKIVLKVNLDDSEVNDMDEFTNGFYVEVSSGSTHLMEVLQICRCLIWDSMESGETSLCLTYQCTT